MDIDQEVKIDRENDRVEAMEAENGRLRAAVNRLQTAYNNKEISGSLWDVEQQCYISLPIFFERILNTKT